MLTKNVTLEAVLFTKSWVIFSRFVYGDKANVTAEAVIIDSKNVGENIGKTKQ